METLLGFIAFFATLFGMVYIHYTTRNKERMALIEKGADASLFNTGKDGNRSAFSFGKLALKVGMLFMGIAVGLLVGALLVSLSIMPEPTCYMSMIFFFGGLSLVLFYIIERKSK